MKKIKKIHLFIAFLIFFSFGGSTTFAETFHKYDIDVVIRKDGTAKFSSIIDLTSTEGTEYYIPVENLGKSKISNFRVKEFVDDKNTISYTFIPDWNIKASIEEKAKKNGIIKTNNGYELAFGIGDYSRKKFLLEYEVTNFVKILNDSDMVFWRFVNDKMTTPPQQVRVKISLEENSLNKGNSKIWGFGSKGEVVFQNDAIKFQNFEHLKHSNYVTILVKLDKGFFNGGEKIDKNFEYYQNIAFKGSSYIEKNLFDKIIGFIFRYKFLIAGFLFVLIVRIFGSTKKYSGGYKKGQLKGEYNRDIPEKEWWKLANILESCNFEGKNSVIRALFLKWIQDGRLLPITEESGFIFKKEVTSLKIIDRTYFFDTDFERDLFSMLDSASGEDGVLQKNEFSKYLSLNSNAEEFKKITDSIEYESGFYIIDKNFIDLKKRKKKYNEEGKEFTSKLIKFYNYLKDFTLLDEREIAEIKVWKELLIYATLFGVVNVVESRLEKLSPEVLEQVEINMGYNYNTMRYMMLYSNSFSNSIMDSYSREVSKGASGSGGFTSVGGGGGSFGGGSGGGSR